MTSAELVSKFKLATEVVSSYEAPGLLDSEIYDMLNTAQTELVLELCTNKNFDSLYSLVSRGVIQLTSQTLSPLSDGGKVYKGTLPADYFFHISSQSGVSRTAMNTTGFIPSYATTKTVIPVDVITPEISGRFIENATNKNTMFLNPVMWIDSGGSTNYTGGVTVIYDSYSTPVSVRDVGVEQLAMLYVRVPDTITASVTSCLPIKLHEMLVMKAVEYRNVKLGENANKN